jgi:hypothetical protein
VSVNIKQAMQITLKSQQLEMTKAYFLFISCSYYVSTVGWLGLSVAAFTLASRLGHSGGQSSKKEDAMRQTQFSSQK